MMKSNIIVIGSDEKMKCCCEKLNSKGFYAVICKSFDDLSRLDTIENIVLPLPSVKDGIIFGTDITLEKLNSVINDNTVIYNGNADEKIFANNSISYCDEGFLLQNARLTAQGVLCVVLSNVKRRLSDVKIAVIGYGRCGYAVCNILKKLGADIVSYSRREETIKAALEKGIIARCTDSINKEIDRFDVIINTVPSAIITTENFRALNEKQTYIEVASKPYGVNLSQCSGYRCKYISAGGLPGIYVSDSAGGIIADSVADKIKGVRL